MSNKSRSQRSLARVELFEEKVLEEAGCLCWTRESIVLCYFKILKEFLKSLDSNDNREISNDWFQRQHSP